MSITQKIKIMKNNFPLTVFGLFITFPFLLIGCNKQSNTFSEAKLIKKQAISYTEQESHPAIKVCAEFLNALLDEDDTTLRELLTPLARMRNEDLGIPFSSSNNLNATFEMHGITLFDQHGAYVQSTLTNTDEQGEKESVEIVWIVAKTSNGWRIAGAATTLFDGQDKTVLNFEDPEAAKKAIAEAERLDLEHQRKDIVRQPYVGDYPLENHLAH